MKKILNEKGITLIALVVTIVILLILAGISISLLSGENGIISQANKSKVQTEIGNEKEIVNLAATSARGKGKWGDILEDNLKEELNNLAGEGKTEVTNLGESYEVLFVDSKRYYEIDKNGEILDTKELIRDPYPGDITKDITGKDLTGYEANPYQINCIEDLVALATTTNAGTTYEGQYVQLMRTLNFNSDYSYANPNTKYTYNSSKNGFEPNETGEAIKTLCTTGRGFVSIGKSKTKRFYGTFLGNNYTLNNMYMNITESTETIGGLFGFAKNGNITYLTVTGKIIMTNATSGFVGGIVGDQEYGSIEGCINKVTINSSVSSGGIVGNKQYGTITNCTNFAEIYGKLNAAGITVNNTSVTTNRSINRGKVESSDGDAGGIAVWNTSNGKIINCLNEASVSGKRRVSGITGSSTSDATINESCNTGTITGGTRVGGICGSMWQEYGCPENITNCYNTGDIMGSDSIGGIIGWGSDQAIVNCYNTGSITGETNVGGIVGFLVWGAEYTRTGLLTGCYNIGNVSNNDKTNTGIIIGGLNGGKLKNCYYLESNTMYGYTYVINSIVTDFEQSNVTKADFYNKDFLINTLEFKEFISEEDKETNTKNVWIINGNTNPTLWWQSK